MSWELLCSSEGSWDPPVFTGPLAPGIIREKSDLPGSQGLGSRGRQSAPAGDGGAGASGQNHRSEVGPRLMQLPVSGGMRVAKAWRVGSETRLRQVPRLHTGGRVCLQTLSGGRRQGS